MSDLFIICGLPGTGKTTTANELSKWLRIPVLYKDFFKENLYELLNMSSLEDSKKLGKISIEIMSNMALRHIENGVDLIIEAPFVHEEDVIRFKHWAKKYPSLYIYTIICSVDNETRYERFINRERHPAHHDLERNSSQILHEEIPQSYSQFPGKQIYIDTKTNTEDIIKQIILSLDD